MHQMNERGEQEGIKNLNLSGDNKDKKRRLCLASKRSIGTIYALSATLLHNVRYLPTDGVGLLWQRLFLSLCASLRISTVRK